MDFVGDEDSVRYALERALREHERITRREDVPLDSLPSAHIARVFLRELEERGWRVSKIPAEEKAP